MIKIKICGITREEDILLIESYPVDYLGFILYPPSPRHVGERLRDLLSYVKRAKKVVVMVNPTYEDAKRALEHGADLLQLHGDEDPQLGSKIGLNRVIKAFRVRETLDYEQLALWKEAHAILLDTFKKGMPGGTGETFDWGIAREAVERGFKIFLAGGLKPENLQEAIISVRPFGIDISSGVEVSPGKKDPEKIRKIFEVLKNLMGGSDHPPRAL